MKFLTLLKTSFLNRASETSTWIGCIGLVLWLLNLKTFLFLLFIIAIFIPETSWDKFTAEKTKEIKDSIESD